MTRRSSLPRNRRQLSLLQLTLLDHHLACPLASLRPLLPFLTPHLLAPSPPTVSPPHDLEMTTETDERDPRADETTTATLLRRGVAMTEIEGNETTIAPHQEGTEMNTDQVVGGTGALVGIADGIVVRIGTGRGVGVRGRGIAGETRIAPNGGGVEVREGMTGGHAGTMTEIVGGRYSLRYTRLAFAAPLHTVCEM